MRTSHKKRDLFFLILLVMILIGVPFGISYYDRYASSQNLPPAARQFTLTGHAERGWLVGEVPAYEAVSFWRQKGQPIETPVLEVSKGDLIVFKLNSSDVLHGFSLKDFGVYLTEGIEPGKATYVRFIADKVGTFTFSCNAVCGDMHQNMQGILIVKA